MLLTPRYYSINWKHFQGEIILWAVYLHSRYGLFYADLKEMAYARGLSIERSTIKPYLKAAGGYWRLDETYVKIKVFGITFIQSN